MGTMGLHLAGGVEMGAGGRNGGGGEWVRSGGVAPLFPLFPPGQRRPGGQVARWGARVNEVTR